MVCIDCGAVLPFHELAQQTDAAQSADELLGGVR